MSGSRESLCTRVVGIIRPVPASALAVNAILHASGRPEARSQARESRLRPTAAQRRRCYPCSAPRMRPWALYAHVMARLTQHGLRRVLGTSALFSTAYGNVGSSIYYALGLVASYALGLTPVVFLLTGAIFYLTAATYAEATAMYPEAGGSSSFARHAFNELWSFFAAWGQMLNYVITIAISAFFVPHYLGGLYSSELLHAPGDILFGIGVVALLSVVNVLGVREAAGLNIVLAVTDLATQLLLVIVGVTLVLSPQVLIDNVHLGIAPTWKSFLIAIPVGMIAYTGIETISNMAEEAKDEAKTIPKAINRVVIAVFAIYALMPAVALSALPVTCSKVTGHCQTLLGLSEDKGGFAGDPVLGIVKHLHLG